MSYFDSSHLLHNVWLSVILLLFLFSSLIFFCFTASLMRLRRVGKLRRWPVALNIAPVKGAHFLSVKFGQEYPMLKVG